MWGNLEPRGLGVLGGGVQGSPTILFLFLFPFVFAWRAPSCELLLTSAPGCGGEVRKRSAERVGRHPPRPAAVAAVCVPRTLPALEGVAVYGACAADMCSVCGCPSGNGDRRGLAG